jgi:hypothetical protein
VENEENEYPVADPNRIMLIMINEPNYAHKKISLRGNYEYH